MSHQGTVVLYHGTDLDSALNILNNGLDVHDLKVLQAGRKTHLGEGWYVTDKTLAAWYFVSIAPGNIDKGFTVLEIELWLSRFWWECHPERSEGST